MEPTTLHTACLFSAFPWPLQEQSAPNRYHLSAGARRMFYCHHRTGRLSERGKADTSGRFDNSQLDPKPDRHRIPHDHQTSAHNNVAQLGAMLRQVQGICRAGSAALICLMSLPGVTTAIGSSSCTVGMWPPGSYSFRKRAGWSRMSMVRPIKSRRDWH